MGFVHWECYPDNDGNVPFIEIVKLLEKAFALENTKKINNDKHTERGRQDAEKARWSKSSMLEKKTVLLPPSC